MRVNYAIVFVSDMKRGTAFYRDVVGLALKFESPEWTEFATEGATLALHQSAVSSAVREDPSSNPPGRCRFGIGVPDIDAFHARMLAHKVPCTQAPKAVHGTRIANYVDPDGLQFSVAEERRR